MLGRWLEARRRQRLTAAAYLQRHEAIPQTHTPLPMFSPVTSHCKLTKLFLFFYLALLYVVSCKPNSLHNEY
jgi:hypothetical protein